VLRSNHDQDGHFRLGGCVDERGVRRGWISGFTGITALTDSHVEVLAGTSFAQLYAELHAAGMTLAWAPGGIQGLTVGGAVAVGFHGSQLSLGGVSSVVSALRVFDLSGVSHDLTDEGQPQLMRAARMMGATPSAPVYLRARSAEAIRKKPGRTEYQRGLVSRADDGQLWVRTTGNQGSGVLSSMVQGNGLIVLHHEQGSVAASEEVDVMMFDGAI
jgi:hypothetical protein